MNRFGWVVALSLASVCNMGAWAAQQAVTDDGMRVLLKDDGMWEPLDTPEKVKADEGGARLEVERRDALANGCKYGLRLTNNLDETIRSLVLRFTAYKPGSIAYDTVTRDFFNIKPTDSQYQTILFRGLTCDQIMQVDVDAADKCRVGGHTSYWYGEDRCIGGIDIIESDLVKIFK
jgi:hypothetical protein